MEAHQKIEVRNPRNGKSDYSFQSINAPSLKKLCEDSKDGHTNFWSKTTIDDRIKILLKWKSELILKKDDIVAALVQDTGRLIESKLEFDVMVQSIDRWCEEGKNLFYSVRDKSKFKGKNVSIFGGGDSALDWAMELSKECNINLIHRRDGFSGAELKALVMEAGMKAISEGEELVTESDFSLALSTIEENRKDPLRNNHEGLYG